MGKILVLSSSFWEQGIMIQKVPQKQEHVRVREISTKLVFYQIVYHPRVRSQVR